MLTSVWNHRLLVVLFAAVFGALGLLVTSMRAPSYVAEAGVLLEDPNPAVLADPRSSSDESRYVANQVAILTSAAVAERASGLARTGDPPADIGASALERNVSVESNAESNYVVVRFRAKNREDAIAGANAVVGAYREIVSGALDADSQAALERLNVAIEEATATLAGTAGVSAAASEAQISAIVSELAQIRDGTLLPSDVTARVRELEAELKAWLLVAQAEASLPAGLAAQRERDDALALLSELRSRQSRLEVDSRLSGDGVALFSPAERAKPTAFSTIAAIAIGIALGALVGAGIAYWRDARTQAFSSRYGPQLLLDAPALAEIPDFRREGLDSRLPVLEAPGTESAEAFRLPRVRHRHLGRPEVERASGRHTDRTGSGSSRS